MVYQYIAYNESGAVVNGKLSAVNEESATELLGYAGYQVISLKPKRQLFNSDKLMAQLFPVKPAEITLFYRQLALLLESGIAITTSLELLEEQASNRTLKRLLGEVIADLRQGNQLSTSLVKHPDIFPPIHCQTLAVGEQAGGLETMLRQIADHIEKEANASKGIKNAMMYPIIASVMMVIVIGILVYFVLPAFSDLYNSLGAQLPGLTRFMLDMAGMMQHNVASIGGGLASVTVLALVYFQTPGGKYRWDKLSLSLPMAGRINHLNELAQFCRSTSLLFRSGLPLTEIMPLMIKSSNNRVMIKSLIDVEQDMLKGEGLSQPMAKNKIFLPMMVQMVRVGEETGNLDTTLLAVAQSYETEAQDRTRSFIAMIQPTMTILIGLAVGILTLSLVSAMYSMYGQML
ncbi:MAG: type II secretion system F family protein [Chloroflexota bacterium]